MRYKHFSYYTVITLTLLTGFYAPLISGQQNFFRSDHGFYFEPLAKYIGNMIGHGHLPLWNPLLHCGMAQVAVSSPGIFYPPNWLLGAFKHGQAFAVLMIFHQCLAGLFALLLILNLGWGAPAAFCAGIIVAFCGYMFSLAANYTLMNTAAWVPMNFWALHKLGQAKEQRQIYFFVCLEALAFFLLIAAGRPELSVPAALSFVLFILIQARSDKADDQTNAMQKSRTTSIWQYFSLLIGLLLSMPVILPAAEWLINSPRAQGLTVDMVFLWSANWYDLLSIVFAQPFGDLTTLANPFLNLAASRFGHLPFVPSPLVGPVAFTLAIWGFSDRNWRERKWLLLLLLLSLLMILGKNAQIFPLLLKHMPCINLFRYPIKLIIIPILLLAFAAARGMYCLAQSYDLQETSAPSQTDIVQVPRKAWLVTVFFWIVVLLIACVFVTAGMLAKPLAIQSLNNSAAAQLLLGKSLLLGSLTGLTTCGLAYLPHKRRISLNWTIVSICALLVCTLYLPAFVYRGETVSNDFYAKRPFVLEKIDKINGDQSTVKSQRILLLYRDPLAVPAAYSWRKDSSQTVNYYAYCRDLILPNTNLDWSQPLTLGYEAAETGDFRKLSFDLVDAVSAACASGQVNGQSYLSLWHFCRASATNWLCQQTFKDHKKLPPLADVEHFQMVIEDDSMNLRIYKVKDALPRAFICRNWSWAPSHKDALACLSGIDDYEFDPEDAALIERLPRESKEYPVFLPPGYYADASPLSSGDLAKHAVPSDAVITQAGVIYPGTRLPAIESHCQPPTFLEDLPEHISISLNLDKENFLILADQFYPGWTARIDGLTTPIFRANGCFRAVYVPKGGHLIQFDYDPLSLTIGLYCAFAGLCLSGWLLSSIAYPYAIRLLRRMAGEVVL